MISYKEVLKIICGGSLEKECCNCRKPVMVEEALMWSRPGQPAVTLLCTAPGVVFCGENDACQVAFDFKMTEFMGWGVASAGVVSNQMHTRCDNCFSLTPSDEIHRSGSVR